MNIDATHPSAASETGPAGIDLPDWRLERLDGQTTLLTVNKRLAAELRNRHDAAQRAAGHSVWPSADILPWNAWLKRGYEFLLDNGFTDLDLLDIAQERLLWQTIIGRQDIPILLRPAAAADSARRSHALCAEWQLDPPSIEAFAADQTQTFLDWQRQFRRQLAEHRLLSAAQLPEVLMEAFRQHQLPVPPQLVLSGFDSLSPLQTHLLTTLRDLGSRIDEHRSQRPPGTRRQVAVADSHSELRLVARWARHQLEQNPDTRIAVVSPQISAQRRDLERVFSEILTPSAYLLGAGEAVLFNISIGESLSSVPLVADALLMLELTSGLQPLQLVGQLLRSPFVGGHAGEWEARALLDTVLREDGLPRIDLRRLRFRIQAFDDADPRHCGDLGARLDRVGELQQAAPAQDSPHNWARRFQAQLTAFGWPGEQPLDSHEYQQHERMRRLFSALAELGKVCPRLSRRQALQQLRALAADTLFQPETPPAAVQILGPLEAAGMEFDAIWLLGMHDQAWPPTARPDPLLPARLQRDRGMPHASAERELQFAGALTDRLLCSAGTIIASHPRSDGEREQRPSPLLQGWPLVEPQGLPQSRSPDVRELCRAVPPDEPLPAAQATPPPPELRGGAGLLGAQAKCPFQAVARFRLQAKALREPGSAADGGLLGSLVHELLQRVWQQLRGSAGLATHDEAALRSLIMPLAEACLEEVARRRPDLFTARFRELEAVRLTRLLSDWLATEKQRGQPFEVIAMERDQGVELGGLGLTTRADRVDRLADGSLAVIDYKTSRTVRNDGWFDSRLTEPQLPLYCVHGDTAVGAALLARVRRDGSGCGFVGVSRETGFAAGVVTPDATGAADDWAGLLAGWRQSLDMLAHEIRHGRADPTPSPAACIYCEFGALCRVRELLAEPNREDSDD